MSNRFKFRFSHQKEQKIIKKDILAFDVIILYNDNTVDPVFRLPVIPLFGGGLMAGEHNLVRHTHPINVFFVMRGISAYSECQNVLYGNSSDLYLFSARNVLSDSLAGGGIMISILSGFAPENIVYIRPSNTPLGSFRIHNSNVSLFLTSETSSKIPISRIIKMSSYYNIIVRKIRFIVSSFLPQSLVENIINNMNISILEFPFAETAINNPIPANVFFEPDRIDRYIINIDFMRNVVISPFEILCFYWNNNFIINTFSNNLIIFSIVFEDIVLESLI